MGKNKSMIWYTIEMLDEVAKSRGGRCLSTEYTTCFFKYLWQDHLGNQWRASWTAVRRGTWSPFLVKEKQRNFNLKYTIEDLHKYAESKGGKCLSTVYTKTKDYYEWVDSKGRYFKKTWEEIITAKQWSPHEKRETLSKLKTIYKEEFFISFLSKTDIPFAFLGIEEGSYQRSRRGIYKNTITGKIHKITPSRLLNFGLPSKFNKMQHEIYKFICSLGLEAHEDNRTIIAPFELDIVIPSLNVAIELDGLRWHNKEKDYHLNKTINAKKAGYDLIHIYDLEWKHHKKQVKSFLTTKLGKSKRKVYARKCEIRTVPKDITKDFLNSYHIQGNVGHIEAFGLYYQDELLSLITIGKHHRDSTKLVLSRFVGKEGVSVLGGLSKLSKAAFKRYGSFITWVDRRISNGENWIKAGWTVTNVARPDYFYFDSNTRKIISKQSRKKSLVNTPEGMTEVEHAKIDGLRRIYDCGKITLEYKLPS